METGGHLGSFSPYLWHDITASTTDVRSVFSRTPPLQHKPAPPFPPSPHPLSAQRRSHHGTDSLVWSPAPCTFISAREKASTKQNLANQCTENGKEVQPLKGGWKQDPCTLAAFRLSCLHAVLYAFISAHNFFTVRDSQIHPDLRLKSFLFPLPLHIKGWGSSLMYSMPILISSLWILGANGKVLLKSLLWGIWVFFSSSQ